MYVNLEMLVATLAKFKQDDPIYFGKSGTVLEKPRRVLPGQGRLLEEGWSAAFDFPCPYPLSPSSYPLSLPSISLLTLYLSPYPLSLSPSPYPLSPSHCPPFPISTHTESELGSPGTPYRFAVGGFYCLNRAMLEKSSEWIG